jgi:hypothetical protein
VFPATPTPIHLFGDRFHRRFAPVWVKADARTYRTTRRKNVMIGRVIPTVAALLLAAAPCAFAQVETVAQFNPSLLETPESIAIDHHNNKYVSLALTGEIRKIAADGSQSTYRMLPLGAPPLTFCGSFFAGLTGLTFDQHDNLYANLASCDPGSRGVWKIPNDGQPATRIGALSLQSLPNGIVHHRDFVYVADSVIGAIWRVPDTGGTAQVGRPDRNWRSCQTVFPDRTA